MRIALFVPCFVDQLEPGIARATVALLERLGHYVVVPDGQTCCGQPALNAGFFDDAAAVARRQLAVLTSTRADAIVAPSGSCVAALSHLAARYLGVKPPAGIPILELSSFLVDREGVEDVGARFDGTVVWHDGCHALRELGIREQPRRLLSHVAGLTLVESESPEACCGFGGTFSVKLSEVSVAIGQRHVEALVASGADAVASTEPSCLLQIRSLLERRRSPLRALHLAQILASQR